MPPSSATARWKPIVRKRRRGERRDVAELAAGDDARGRVGQLLVDAQLELAARQQARARDVAGLVGVLLAHVEDDELVGAALDARAQLGHAHEGHVRGRLGEHLADGLAAAHVGAQRLGQVGRHRQVEALHHLHERGALALLQARIARDLGADGRVAAPLVVVRRVDEQRRVEREQAAEQAVVERLRVAARQVGAAGAADQQGVAGEDAVLADQAHRVGGVAGRVQHLQAQLAEDDRLAVVDAHRRSRAPGWRGASPSSRRAARRGGATPRSDRRGCGCR